MELNHIFQEKEVKTSVPCRVDFGGTLDITTFYLPLNKVSPSSFNIALNLRTYVKLSGFEKGYVKVSSKGFESAVFEKFRAPFDHPMGLMFAIADYFNADGVHIQIESTSPPRSALGGSSSAAVAVISAFYHVLGKDINSQEIAWLAHYIESSVAGVPCGMQDQLAAAFGGVNQWFWTIKQGSPHYFRKQIIEDKNDICGLNSNILVAYCGIPHVSKDINKRWTDQFICGNNRDTFEKIAKITSDFSNAVKEKDFIKAALLMNQETELRLEMTPDVLDETGKNLYRVALDTGCGTRFTGAGGGGCLWSIGMENDIKKLSKKWKDLLSKKDNAMVLDTLIDDQGILIHK